MPSGIDYGIVVFLALSVVFGFLVVIFANKIDEVCAEIDKQVRDSDDAPIL